ncbi:unnamed protein product [Ixodes persulcatus]
MQRATLPCRRARENFNVFPIATLNLEITNRAPGRVNPGHSENAFSVGRPKSRQNSPLICPQRSRRCAAKHDTFPRQSNLRNRSQQCGADAAPRQTSKRVHWPKRSTAHRNGHHQLPRDKQIGLSVNEGLAVKQKEKGSGACGMQLLEARGHGLSMRGRGHAHDRPKAQDS